MKMKMNFKYAFMACAVLMAGFTSCSDDAEVDNSGVVPNGKPTVAKITLTQQGSSTRAADADSEPTNAEKEIKTATLYIFNASKTFVSQVDFDVEASPNVASKTVELTTGTHYFYALVNYPGTAPTFPVNTTLAAVTSHVNNKIALTAMSELMVPANGFFMTSIGEPVVKDLKEATKSQAATENPVVLKVGRAMAKVNASFEATVANSQPITGTLGSVFYQGANNPKSIFALPNYVGNQLQSPYFNETSVTVANYFPALPATFPVPADEIENLWVTAENNKTDGSNAIYVAENSNQTPKEGNSTFLLIKGTFSPKVEYCYDGNDGTALTAAIPTGTTFWCAATADGKTVYKKRFFSGTNAPKATVLADLTAELSDGNTYTQAIKYENGLAYYPFFLENNDPTLNRVGKYTTARNNYYGVTITSVSDLGSNTPGGTTDPEKPLGAEAWISGTINILPWTVVTQTGGI